MQKEGVHNILSHRDLRRHILFYSIPFHSILLCSIPFRSRGGTSCSWTVLEIPPTKNCFPRCLLYSSRPPWRTSWNSLRVPIVRYQRRPPNLRRLQSISSLGGACHSLYYWIAKVYQSYVLANIYIITLSDITVWAIAGVSCGVHAIRGSLSYVHIYLITVSFFPG